MDSISIKDLEIYAYHGVNEEEKKLGQKFSISLKMYVDLKKAGISDDISDTINYAEVIQDIKSICISKSYNLIETLAEEVARYLLKKYRIINSVKVEVKKPWAPVGCILNYVCISIHRER
ncbi:MAG: dihydroneopterin aldolase [Clostridia bacterium]|nr:dihydroneopterin aldolase [Clostridia bacterium]